MVPTDKLAEFYGKDIIVADREMVESVRCGALLDNVVSMQHGLFGYACTPWLENADLDCLLIKPVYFYHVLA